MDHAPFPARAMAFFIDSTILGFFCAGYFTLVSTFLPGGEEVTFRAVIVWIVSTVLFFFVPPLLGMIYFTVFHASCGQTIGKMLMGVQVVAVSGKPLSFGLAFLRWTGYFLSALPLGAGFLWPLCGINSTTWHDKLAGTVVVSTSVIHHPETT